VAAERAATAAAADAAKVAPADETPRGGVGEAARKAAREARPPGGDSYGVEPKRWDRGEDGEHSRSHTRGVRFASKPSDEDKENATRIGASEKNPPREGARFLSRPPPRRATAAAAAARGEPGKTPVARRTRAGRAQGGA
jgi:hypothetical protein